MLPLASQLVPARMFHKRERSDSPFVHLLYVWVPPQFFVCLFCFVEFDTEVCWCFSLSCLFTVRWRGIWEGEAGVHCLFAVDDDTRPLGRVVNHFQQFDRSGCGGRLTHFTLQIHQHGVLWGCVEKGWWCCHLWRRQREWGEVTRLVETLMVWLKLLSSLTLEVPCGTDFLIQLNNCTATLAVDSFRKWPSFHTLSNALDKSWWQRVSSSPELRFLLTEQGVCLMCFCSSRKRSVLW